MHYLLKIKVSTLEKYTCFNLRKTTNFLPKKTERIKLRKIYILSKHWQFTSYSNTIIKFIKYSLLNLTTDILVNVLLRSNISSQSKTKI